MIIQQGYHSNFKFSDIQFQKHELAEIAEMVGADVPEHLKPWLHNMLSAERAEILCKDHAVISISKAESQWSGETQVNLIKGEGDYFEVSTLNGNEINNKTHVSKKDLLKLIARLNDQATIEWQTHDSWRYLPADVEVVYLDLSAEEFNEDDIVLPSDEELLYPAPRVNKNGYLVRLNNLAAEKHGLDAIGKDGFHCSLVVGVDDIEVLFRQSNANETRVFYNVENTGMGMLARMIRGTNENPGDFVIEILNTEKLAGEG